MQGFILSAVFLLAQVAAWADGGTVQMRQEAGGLVITVFTSPSPLSVGPADISVLLQNRDGLDPVLDANVHLILSDDASGIEFHALPTRAQARNQLLYAAPVMFARPGKWKIGVLVERHGKEIAAEGILDVSTARAKVSYAGYIAFPPVVIVLFVIRERLIRRRTRR